MISQFERWLIFGLGMIILVMFVGAGLASHQRDSCRLDLAKAGRSAEDIVKICP
jgi:hypothetical protein